VAAIILSRGDRRQPVKRFSHNELAGLGLPPDVGPVVGGSRLVLSGGAGDARGERAEDHALVPVPSAPELPCREAPDVDVILVDPEVGAIVRELDLELQLVISNR
jgi:hypothetical protein